MAKAHPDSIFICTSDLNDLDRGTEENLYVSKTATMGEMQEFVPAELYTSLQRRIDDLLAGIRGAMSIQSDAARMMSNTLRNDEGAEKRGR